MHRLCSKIPKLKSREIDLIKLLAVKLNDSYALLITIMVLPLLNYCVIGLPFDLYQYQRDPSGDNQMIHITCCHVSALLRPVFCIARNLTDIGNQATSMVFGESNTKRQQFCIITLNRWHPRLEEGRKYDSFYSDKQTRNKNSWAVFNKEAVIKEYRSSLLRTIQK